MNGRGGFWAPLRSLALLLAAAVLLTEASPKDDDLIGTLPGLTFNLNFKQYSGYLQTGSKNQFHYWFTESQGDPSKDPFVLWLNGGPGCSSLISLFNEIGPFHANPDNATLFENVYSWNKIANVLFLESPHNVGFSYRPASEGPDDVYTDDKTATDNADALAQFLERFPEYKTRDFYITGESYAGVYIPTLAKELITRIQAKKITLNFKGMAIGNGELSLYNSINAGVDLVYARGIIDKIQYEKVKMCCAGDSKVAPQKCDLNQFVSWDDQGKPHYKGNNTQCSKLAVDYGFNKIWKSEDDVYNTYQDCYVDTATTSTIIPSGISFSKSTSQDATAKSPINDGRHNFVDQGAKINTKSTDQLMGFPCWASEYRNRYLNRPEIRELLHIPPEAPAFSGCNDTIGDGIYVQQYHDTAPVFDAIFNSGYNLRILIYNGDADMACDFLADQWFVEAMADKYNFSVALEYQPWFYTQTLGRAHTPAGTQKLFTYNGNTIDLLTVKGAGHFVPMNRPGPALQMISNFIQNTGNYSSFTPVSTDPKPVLTQYAPWVPPPLSRKEADQITNLPGLSFQLDLTQNKQYSGYLQASKGNFLHYWLVESQTNPATDPLVLWLNGGPGCSSLGGFLTELGPFHVNQDNTTLFENVYSWNKGANVLFLEGPRNVGFSYQDRSTNPDDSYDDAKTANDNFLAIMDFLSVYPEYRNRPFYVAGESYGGVYVPTLTSLLVDKIQAHQAPGLNLVGMAVGNGELSAVQQLNSAISLLYYHGIYGKDDWDFFALKCCPNVSTYQELYKCDFTQYVYLDSAGNVQPKDGSGSCGAKVAEKSQRYFWGLSEIQDVYNIYQDCYQQSDHTFGVYRDYDRYQATLKTSLYKKALRYGGVNDYSTDNQGGYPCFASTAAANWLNSDDVRDALHVPTYVASWTDCNDTINAIYTQQHNDTGSLFDHMISSGYPLRVLVYNGDVDTACNFLGDQWFVEGTATRNGLSTAKKYGAWNYEGVIGGYWKRFAGSNVTLDLLTVKGAGHMVPMDRPGPALQMITNFLAQQDYSKPSPFKTRRSPLKAQYKVMQKMAASAAGQSVLMQKAIKKHGIEKNVEEKPIEKVDIKAAPIQRSKEDDKITNLPGLTFTPTFDQYSGFLDVDDNVHMHYWFVEAQSNKENAPIVLWLQGGPGCSSLLSLMEEIGPFRPSKDGKLLLENPFSWNKYANIFFIESPRNVGFSYQDGNDGTNDHYNDTYTAHQNVLAVQEFFKRFPQYQNRPFYITGESYGGVYIPTLVYGLLKKLASPGAPNINLAGFAIGNGIFSLRDQINSAVDLLYFRGVIDKEQIDGINQCCQNADPLRKTEPCDFSRFLNFKNMIPSLMNASDPFWAKCGRLAGEIGEGLVWLTSNDVYNTYQDCYNTEEPGSYGNVEETRRRSKRSAPAFGNQVLSNTLPFVDQASQIDYLSTDPMQGFYCWADNAVATYLNSDDVKKAIHVDAQSVPQLKNVKWTGCNTNSINNATYSQQNADMTPVFNSILSSKRSLRALIYNGDVDMACEFLGDEVFIERLMSNHGAIPTERTFWNYTLHGYKPRIGGFSKRFNVSATYYFDQLTIKGSGHMVPMDRPGPALQIFHNFLQNIDYSTPLPEITTQPILPNFLATPPPTPSRMEEDRIYDLPGLTFAINFKQYSGYLNAAVKGSYLHYWFVESQSDPKNDPVILWLTGGSGCSSLGALMTEIGPFHPNPDGSTLFENVYAWNKGYNVLFLESPRMVGFSYQDRSVDPDTDWNDNKTSADNLAAVKDFFNVFSHLQKNDFYVAGESYAGVYVPTLVQRMMKDPQLNFNLKGMSIGNGLLSQRQNIRTMPDFLYFHGHVDYRKWSDLKSCCKNEADEPMLFCDYDKFINLDTYQPYTNTTEQKRCGELVIEMNSAFDTAMDVYNFYQECYENEFYGSYINDYPNQPPSSASSYMQTRWKRLMQAKTSPKVSFNNLLYQVNYGSTDALGGFPCYAVPAAHKYLNHPHVRAALHVPEYVQEWMFCTDAISYDSTSHDSSPVWMDILNMANTDARFAYFKILVYNGDLDMACSMFEDQWFVEALYTRALRSMTARVVNDHGDWAFETAKAGFQKEFQFGKTRLELLSVKGAGHMVPTDRSGPALQMINNFIQLDVSADTIVKAFNFSKPFTFDTTRKPLLPQYKPVQSSVPTETPATTTSSTPATPVVTTTTSTTKITATTVDTTTTTRAASTLVRSSVIAVLFALAMLY
ncbi:hypothetical protein QR680_019183 [Steinernema hermaphroditum]|uniref:Carboxypeptidase n=1 Tax=Steinernema hermaphroditum TaxID=289476 RepID=A0AA39HK72_9BILA|nr:hypothetical protein QR680_019183 [Steinernema hermaphroditum]